MIDLELFYRPVSESDVFYDFYYGDITVVVSEILAVSVFIVIIMVYGVENLLQYSNNCKFSKFNNLGETFSKSVISTDGNLTSSLVDTARDGNVSQL